MQELTSKSARSDSADLLSVATRIAERVAEESTHLPDGTVTWNRGYGIDFGPVEDAGIFNGRVGECLFLASLFDATEEPIYRTLALGGLRPVQRGLRNNPAAIADRVGLGLTGIGSIIYALVRLSILLDDAEFLDAARNAASAITADRIAQDNRLDVFFGSAGCLLGLLALAGSEPSIENVARACAEHLLKCRVEDEVTKCRAWAPSSPTPCTGFAHGSSGIAHALLRLHALVGDEQYYDAAIEAFAFERDLYDDEMQDWPDVRDQTDRRTLCSWCHGAPGVGLSRLSALNVLRPADESDIATDLGLALRRTLSRPVTGVDCICCGTFGRVDFLLEVARRIGNRSVESAAYAMAERSIARSQSIGFQIPQDIEQPQFSPGFWQGLSGIGYVILRLVEPNKYPSVLRLD